MTARFLGRRIWRNVLLLPAALAAAIVGSLAPTPSLASQSRFTKAELCQVLYPCEPPTRYRSGRFVKQPRIVDVSMRQVEAICAGRVSHARNGDFPYTVMGCAELTGTECIVHISTSLKTVSPLLYDLVLAHELGHCRGWRHD